MLHHTHEVPACSIRKVQWKRHVVLWRHTGRCSKPTLVFSGAEDKAGPKPRQSLDKYKCNER